MEFTSTIGVDQILRGARSHSSVIVQRNRQSVLSNERSSQTHSPNRKAHLFRALYRIINLFINFKMGLEDTTRKDQKLNRKKNLISSRVRELLYQIAYLEYKKFKTINCK